MDYSASSYRGWWFSLLPIDKRIRALKIKLSIGENVQAIMDHIIIKYYSRNWGFANTFDFISSSTLWPLQTEHSCSFETQCKIR